MKLHLHKKILSHIFLSLTLIFSSFPTVARAESLGFSVRCTPSSKAIQGEPLFLTTTSNQDSYLTINAETKSKIILLFDNKFIEANVEQEIVIPIVYPLNENFTLSFHLKNIDSTDSTDFSKDFTVENQKNGEASFKGRVINGSSSQKIGLEGAFIEVISGPTFAFTESCDDGYFEFNHLIPGPYKFKITHSCTNLAEEVIIEVKKRTPFSEITINPHNVPEFDFWMNKSSGSNYEVKETATIFMRSKLNMKVNLFLINDKNKEPILLNFSLQKDEISRFFWIIPTSTNLGKHYFSLEPAESGLCGCARYSIQIATSIENSALIGCVVVDDKPVKGVDVSFPYEYLPHTKTDEYGKFEITDLPSGNYNLRFTLEGFKEKNIKNVDIVRSQINGPITVMMEAQEDNKISFLPSRLDFTTHERRSKTIPILCFMKNGYASNISIEKIEGPDGIFFSSDAISSLLQEKQLLSFTISETVLPGKHHVKFEVNHNSSTQFIEGTVYVQGLSSGTFDGSVSPPGISIPQGKTANYIFSAEKFTNFNERLSIRIKNLPSYTQLIFDKEKKFVPPCEIPFSIDTSLSTKVFNHEIELEVFSGDQKNIFVFPLNIFPRKGQITTCPTEGWNPILQPGKESSLSISCFSTSGFSQNVRLNKDYGPDWVSIKKHDIGSVTKKPISTQINFSPPDDILIGGYPYSISFTYGENNEEYKKFSGQIYIQKANPKAPINARGKFIAEGNSIILTWDPPIEDDLNIIGYNVYRSLHYPALSNSHPLNSTLISGIEFIDTTFLYGENYWYVVKAVFQDGSISSPSNTSQVIVPPKEDGAIIVSLEKPSGSSYYTNSPIPVNFQATIYGKVSISCSVKYLDALLFEKAITPGTKYRWTPILPELPDSKCILTIIFEGEGGYKETRNFYFFSKEQKSGACVVSGALLNSVTKKPLHGAHIQIIDGPTYGVATTDENGNFRIKHLAVGFYNFSIQYNGSNHSFESFDVVNGENNLDPWTMEYYELKDFMVWSGNLQNNKIPLWIFSEDKNTASIYWEKNQTRRIIHNQVHLDESSTNLMKFSIPEDLPAGEIQITVELNNSNRKKSVFYKIPEIRNDTDIIFGYVKNLDGLPLKEAVVNGNSVNEWGYFEFHNENVNKLEVSAPYYKSKIQAVESTSNEVSIYLEKNIGSLYHSQEDIFIAGDFNNFVFQWSIKDGWITLNDIQLFIANELPEYEIRTLNCNPDVIYTLKYNNILREQLTETSHLSIKTFPNENNSFKEEVIIDIKMGVDDKFFFSSKPRIPVFKQSQKSILLLDIYTYSDDAKLYLVKSSFDEKLNSFINSTELNPGNSCLLTVDPLWDSDSMLNRPILGHIVISDQKNNKVEDIPIHVYFQSDEQPHFVNPQWDQVYYQGSHASHTFYLSETPSKIFCRDVPNFVDIEFFDNKAMIDIKYVPNGETAVEIPVTINDKFEERLILNVQGIHKIEQWHAPLISAKNKEKSVELSIQNLIEGNVYKVNRYKQNFCIDWQTEFTQAKTYVDKKVQDKQIVYYQLFTSNLYLESGWSNLIKNTFSQLTLNIDSKDSEITNKRFFLFKGSISIGATLTINSIPINITKQGQFSFNAPLNEGLNKFTFNLEDKYGNKLKKTISVNRDTISPEINVLSPPGDLFYTKNTELLVSIKSDPESTVLINGTTVEEIKPGIFNMVVNLKTGENVLEISSTDLATNESAKTISVIQYSQAFLIELQITNKEARVNGKKILLDVPPQVISGRTVVPLRFIAESFGAKIEWLAETKEIKITLNQHKIYLQIGNNYAVVNNKKILLDVPPQVISGRTVVPLRFIAESFGAKIEWLAETKEIKITLYV